MRTVITGQDVVNNRDAERSAITRIALATGALNVKNSWCKKRYLVHADALDITIGFDSRGWTGR